MKVRNLARLFALTALTAAVGVIAPAASAAHQPSPAGGGALTSKPPATAKPRPRLLPACPAGRASNRPPTRPAGSKTPGACRAAGHILESTVRLTRPEQTAFTPSGYHHLGANSAGEWSGVSGRISVVDGSIRPGSYDFIAGRFMAKRNMGGGQVAWLEAGWAETGWAGPGRQHVYTFNTNTKTWQFYDQYVMRPGDRAWFDLHSDTDGVWGAWLWWNNRWNLLTAQRLPIGGTAMVEQYVEVHVDTRRPTRVDVPAVTVDNVQVRPPGGGPARYWNAEVPTLTGYGPGAQQRTGGFCLNWINRYDTWTAGDCTAEDLTPAPAPTAPAPTAPAASAPASSATAPRAPAPSAPATTAPAAGSSPSPSTLLGGLLGG